MKKILSILLSLLIVVTSSGVSLSLDYCPFQKKTTLSFNEEKSCCCGGDQSMPDDCCNKTKIVVEKIKDNYTPTIHSTISPAQIILLAVTYTESFLFLTPVSQIQSSFLSDSSPPNTPVPLSILYRSILI